VAAQLVVGRQHHQRWVLRPLVADGVAIEVRHLERQRAEGAEKVVGNVRLSLVDLIEEKHGTFSRRRGRLAGERGCLHRRECPPEDAGPDVGAQLVAVPRAGRRPDAPPDGVSAPYGVDGPSAGRARLCVPEPPDCVERPLQILGAGAGSDRGAVEVPAGPLRDRKREHGLPAAGLALDE